MPCPPDPYEQEFHRSWDESSRLTEQYGKLFGESRHTLEAARKLLALAPASPHAAPLADAMAPLQARTATPAGGHPDHELVADHGNLAAAIHEATAPVDAMKADVKTLENELCALRDALLRFARLTDHARHAVLDQERALHLAHRRADRDLALATAREDLKRFGRPSKVTKKYFTDAQIAEYAATAQRDVARLEALTDEQLLESRDL